MNELVPILKLWALVALGLVTTSFLVFGFVWASGALFGDNGSLVAAGILLLAGVSAVITAFMYACE